MNTGETIVIAEGVGEHVQLRTAPDASLKPIPWKGGGVTKGDVGVVISPGNFFDAGEEVNQYVNTYWKSGKRGYAPAKYFVPAPTGAASPSVPAGDFPPLPDHTEHRPAQLRIVKGNFADAKVGVPYKGDVMVTGGKKPYKFSAAGLPKGMTIDENSGIVSGTPHRAGSESIQVTVTDAAKHSWSEPYGFGVGGGHKHLPKTPARDKNQQHENVVQVYPVVPTTSHPHPEQPNIGAATDSSQNPEQHPSQSFGTSPSDTPQIEHLADNPGAQAATDSSVHPEHVHPPYKPGDPATDSSVHPTKKQPTDL